MTVYYVHFASGNDNASGISWNTAWKTLANGPTVARIYPGDTVRINKTPQYPACGSGLFKYNNNYIPVAASCTGWYLLYQSSLLWNGASANVTNTMIVNAAPVRIPTGVMQIAPAAAFTTGKMAWIGSPNRPFATPLNLSGYQQISCLIRSSVVLQSGDLVLGVCNDAAGGIFESSGILPKYLNATVWSVWKFDMKRPMGTGLNSLCLYATRDFGAASIWIDNVIAIPASTGANSFSHYSMISPVPATDYNTTGWYCIGGFDTSGIYIEGLADSAYLYKNDGSGHIVPSGWFPLYRMEPQYDDMARSTTSTTYLGTLPTNGTPLRYITYEGGWNPETNIRDGYTWLGDANMGQITSFNLNEKSYFNHYHIGYCRGASIHTAEVGAVTSRFVNFKNLCFTSVQTPFYNTSTSYGTYASNHNWTCDFLHTSNYYGPLKIHWSDSTIDNLYIISCYPQSSTYYSLSSRVDSLYINNLYLYNITVGGITPGNIYKNLYFNNTVSDIQTPFWNGSISQSAGSININSISKPQQTAIVAGQSYHAPSYLRNVMISGYQTNQVMINGGLIIKQTGLSVDGSSSFSWRFSPASNYYCIYHNPIHAQIYGCFVESGKKVDITCWMRRDALDTYGAIALRDIDNNITVLDCTGWLQDFKYRRRLTVTNYYSYSGLLAFPLYVPIKNDYVFGGYTTSGIDICFTKRDGLTKLNYERNTYSLTKCGAANTHYWVQTDIDETNDTYIYVYYGATGVPIDYSNATGVWSNNYVGVWHFNESGFPYIDSTINQRHFVSGVAPYYKTSDAPGQCSQVFLSSNKTAIHAGKFIEHSPRSSNFSIEVLYRPSGAYSTINDYLICTGGHIPTISGYNICVGTGANSGVFCDGGGTANDRSAQNFATLPSGYSWVCDVMALDRTPLQHVRYRGPYPVTKTAYNAALTDIINAENLTLGSGIQTTDYFNGEVDELRISTTQRLDNWFKFQWYNWFSPYNMMWWDCQDIRASITGQVINTWIPITLTCYPQQDGYLKLRAEAYGGPGTRNNWFDKITYTET